MNDFTCRLQSVRHSRSRAASKCGKIIEPRVRGRTNYAHVEKQGEARKQTRKTGFLVLRVCTISLCEGKK